LRPFTPPFALICFTASDIPSRTWIPHGVKFPVSDVNAPIAIGPLAAELPDESQPPKPTASSATTPATTATNHNRFMSPLHPQDVCGGFSPQSDRLVNAARKLAFSRG
jgi:hypothetical protein